MVRCYHLIRPHFASSYAVICSHCSIPRTTITAEQILPPQHPHLSSTGTDGNAQNTTITAIRTLLSSQSDKTLGEDQYLKIRSSGCSNVHNNVRGENANKNSTASTNDYGSLHVSSKACCESAEATGPHIVIMVVDIHADDANDNLDSSSEDESITFIVVSCILKRVEADYWTRRKAQRL